MSFFESAPTKVTALVFRGPGRGNFLLHHRSESTIDRGPERPPGDPLDAADRALIVAGGMIDTPPGDHVDVLIELAAAIVDGRSAVTRSPLANSSTRPSAPGVTSEPRPRCGPTSPASAHRECHWPHLSRHDPRVHRRWRLVHRPAGGILGSMTGMRERWAWAAWASGIRFRNEQSGVGFGC